MIIKGSRVLLIISFIFCAGIIISSCKKDTPPPLTTTIHGYVTDAATGKPFPGLQMEAQSYIFFVYYNDHAVTTNADGSFYLKYTPKGENPRLVPVSEKSYYETPFPSITAGQDNNFNIKTYKLVNLTIRLTNASGQSRSNYMMLVSNGYFGAVFYTGSPAIDTVLQASLPQTYNYTLKSKFFNGFSNQGFADSVVFTKNVYLGTKDTTISVVNP